MKIAPLSLFLTFFNLHILITTINAHVDQSERKLSFQNRIVNGRDAKVGQFPHQLSLRRSSNHICGASVLDGSWAITAAHCIDGFEKMPNLFSIRMGTVARLIGGRVTEVKGIYKHPSYNPETMSFDVALLRTSDNAFSGNNVATINLPQPGISLEDNEAVTVSGWGHMSSSDHVLSSVLKYTIVSVVNQGLCSEALQFQGGITDAMFCAAARDTDACQGDSGGPIISEDNILIGVVSWGVGCADPHYPGVYTRLSYPPIRGWIRLLTKL